MNKAHFQSMFGSTKGAVYRFIGEVPEGQDPTVVVTEKFIEAVGTDLVSIVVVNINSGIVLYSDYTEELASTEFEFLTDLIPDPVIEVGVPDPAIIPTEEV